MKKSNVIRLVTEKKISGMDQKEIELIERISNGDEKAFKELYLLYYSRLSRFITKINGGQSLDEIVRKISELSGLINEISNATTEQSSGVGEISQAMASIDSITQHNAGMAEYSSGQTRLLSEEVGKMTNVLREFKTQSSEGLAERRADVA